MWKCENDWAIDSCPLCLVPCFLFSLTKTFIMISIIEFEDKYAEDFLQLNKTWLDKYGLMESHDMEILNDPKGKVIDRGGCIYLAVSEDKIVGSAALIKGSGGEYELAKMAVSQPYQGKGISKLLIQKCLDKAKELGASKLILFSNSQLQTALKLYTSYGFRHMAVTGAPYESADVKMELGF